MERQDREGQEINMDAVNYQLMALAGIAFAGYIINRNIRNRTREDIGNFVKNANEIYIPRLKQIEAKVTQLVESANKSLDSIRGVN